jgi:hypothetical protein
MFTALLFILSALLQMVLPWWAGGLLCFALSLGWNKGPRDTFIKCGISQGALWLVYILYTDVANNHLLSARIARMFALPNATLLIALSVVVIFIASGLAGLAGTLLRIAFLPSKSNDDSKPGL